MRQHAAGSTGPCTPAAPGAVLRLFKGALVGFTLGLGLALVASSWIWLEMRVNVGLLVPLAALCGAIIAVVKPGPPSYFFFALTQGFLVAALPACYGFDPGAFRTIPASLVREGFGGTNMELDTVRFLLESIFIIANLLWISHEKWYKIKRTLVRRTPLEKREFQEDDERN